MLDSGGTISNLIANAGDSKADTPKASQRRATPSSSPGAGSVHGGRAAPTRPPTIAGHNCPFDSSHQRRLKLGQVVIERQLDKVAGRVTPKGGFHQTTAHLSRFKGEVRSEERGSDDFTTTITITSHRLIGQGALRSHLPGAR